MTTARRISVEVISLHTNTHKLRSPNRSEERARIRLVKIWRTALGIVRRFDLKVEKPRRRSVRLKYA